MFLRVIALCALASLFPASAAFPAKILKMVAYFPTGKAGPSSVNDFELVEIPQFVLLPSPVDHRAVKLYCSPKWGGVIATIDGKTAALNQAAIQAVDGGMKLMDDGQVVPVFPYSGNDFALSRYREVVGKMTDRALKQCNPGGRPAVTAPSLDVSVKNAQSLCALVDAAGVTSEPCNVSIWSSAVQISIDTSALEARAICARLKRASDDKAMRFSEGWTIQIASPFSGDRTIARCNL